MKIWNIQAITLFPVVLFSESKEQVSTHLFRHELEHVYQIQKVGLWTFYFLYLKFYFQFRIQGFSHHEAYFGIPFEVEARKNESLALTEQELALLGRAPRETV